MHAGRWAFTVGVIAALAGAAGLAAQVQFARGQDVAPVFEGWEPNPDGTFSMVFGYLNRNYQEELDIPVGPDNTIDVPGQAGADHGQPTHFYPRRQRFIFKVTVPKDFDINRRVVWTLVSRGKTNQAKGWLQPEWELNDGVIAENSGGGVPHPNNKPPSIAGDSNLTATLSSPVTLSVTATDDGLPLSRAGRVSVAPDPAAKAKGPVTAGGAENLRQGVKLTWSLYRGPGRVVFDPDASELVHGTPVNLTTQASFGAPGLYVLRATATDGQLFSYHHVTVTVR
jgi:hypothetical protein